ncbi:MAG: hypothetical protein CL758_03065 [Chloroflexi bacterium]|nr:hypothetical protein [Chloroflexota bacterium]|tara:strand:- start:30824 stop:33136 length:2313 start_codon:yes stop_codon:yes gene_type:complete
MNTKIQLCSPILITFSLLLLTACEPIENSISVAVDDLTRNNVSDNVVSTPIANNVQVNKDELTKPKNNINLSQENDQSSDDLIEDDPGWSGFFDCEEALYVANEGNGGGGKTVVKIDCEGEITTFASGFIGTSGLVADDVNGYLYISDDSPGIYRVNINGDWEKMEVRYSDKSPEIFPLINPNALSIDSEGRLLVADSGSNIYRMTLSEESPSVLIVTNLLAEGFNIPQGVIETVEGDVLFSDHDGYIYRITNEIIDSGIPITWPAEDYRLPVGQIAQGNQGSIILDKEGNIYTSNFGWIIVKISPDGETYKNVVQIPQEGCEEGQAGGQKPSFRGLTFDTEGDLVATGYCLDNIYIFNSDSLEEAWKTDTPINELPEPFAQNVIIGGQIGALDIPDLNGPFGIAFFDNNAIGFEIEKTGGTPPGPPSSTPISTQDPGYPVFDSVGIGSIHPAQFTDCNQLRLNSMFTIVNENGSNEVFGTEGNDIIDGKGAQKIYGLGGDDIICGGFGKSKNIINGGAGNDVLIGEGGSDELWGGEGNDVLRGEGNLGNIVEKLYGGPGIDWLDGGPGKDHLFGGEGGDYLFGGEGDDKLYGDNIEDSINKEKDCPGQIQTCDDYLIGGKGSDSLYGGPGQDWIHADVLKPADEDSFEDDVDYLNGNQGNDILFAIGGKNTFYGNEGNDTIVGGNTEEGIDSIWGGEEADRIWGRKGYDNIDGGLNKDNYETQILNDELYGGEGDDELSGAKVKFGGSGNDICRGVYAYEPHDVPCDDD